MLERTFRAAYFAGSMKPEHDGVTRVLYKLANHLKSEEIPSLFFSAIVPPENEQPVQMIQVPSVTFPFYPEYKLAVPGYKSFEKELYNFNADIIHINSPCSLGCAAIKYGRKYQIPVVATYHTHFTSYAKYYNVKPLQSAGWNYLRNIYNKCELVYVPSEPILEELRDNDINNLLYLPHGVDTKVFNPNFKSEEWKNKLGLEGKTVLIFAGRLVWEKGLRLLADAFQIIKAARNDTALVLAGDGPAANELKQMLPEAVFLGQLQGDDLSTAYASSDIFVFPSGTETFGNVTLEAMACGLPPVCVREGGAYGIIKEGETGLIADPENPSSFAGKTLSLIIDKQLHSNMGRHASVFAKSQSWEKIFDRLFETYRQVIENYRRSRRTAA